MTCSRTRSQSEERPGLKPRPAGLQTAVRTSLYHPCCPVSTRGVQDSSPNAGQPPKKLLKSPGVGRPGSGDPREERRSWRGFRPQTGRGVGRACRRGPRGRHEAALVWTRTRCGPRPNQPHVRTSPGAPPPTAEPRRIVVVHLAVPRPLQGLLN